MGKSAILKKIHNAAKNYQRYLAGKTFMYVYEEKSIEVVFKNSSFLHLTGVNTKLKAKEFYKHAKTKNGLKVSENVSAELFLREFDPRKEIYNEEERSLISQAWTDIYVWLLFIVYKNVRTTLLRNRMSGGVWIGNKSIYPLSDIDMTVIFIYD